MALVEQTLFAFCTRLTGDVIVEAFDDLLGLVDAFLSGVNQSIAALFDRGDFALEVDGNGIKLSRRETKAPHVVRF